MGYAKVRNGNWHEIELRDIEGNDLEDDWTPNSLWVKSICFDSMQTALYVLTDDDVFYFTAHSIDLEFTEDEERVKRENASSSMLVEMLKFNLDTLNTEKLSLTREIDRFYEEPSLNAVVPIRESLDEYEKLIKRIRIQIADFQKAERA